MVEFFLVDNHLTEDPDDCRAITQHKSTVTMEQLVKLIMLRSAGLTESEISSVLKEYFVAMEYFLEEGNRIVTPFFNITPTVSGVFEDKKASFDKTKHRIRIKVAAGVELKKVASKIGAEKIRGNKHVPFVDDVYDYASDSTDDILSPGQPLRLTGEYLKLDKADTGQGVFFVNTADQTETRATMYIESRNKQIALLVPDALTSGIYTLKVKAQMGNEVRVGEFSTPLTVS